MGRNRRGSRHPTRGMQEVCRGLLGGDPGLTDGDQRTHHRTHHRVAERIGTDLHADERGISRIASPVYRQGKGPCAPTRPPGGATEGCEVVFAEQDLPGGVHRHHVQWPAVDEHGSPGRGSWRPLSLIRYS